MRKFVSFLLVVVIVIHGVTFSVYSVPTSSIPTGDNASLCSEFLPDLVGGDAAFVLEVPDSITYIWVRCEDNPSGSMFRDLHKECVIN